MSKNTELQKRFENHIPLAIYPFGIGSNTGPRVIAEGFVYPEGVFFFDIGWNNPMAGTGTDHFVEGKIEGPFPDCEETMYWKVGKHATIHEIPEDDYSSSFANELSVGKNNRERAERYQGDKYKSRNRAQGIADRFIDEHRRYHQSEEE